MKRSLLLSGLILTVVLFSSCQQEKGPSSNVTNNESPDISNNAYIRDVHKESLVTNEAIDYLLGSHDLYDIVQALGEPDKKEEHENFERWYFNEGVEIDVDSMNDYLVITNYIFVNNESDLQISEEIGIGSTYEQVTDAYGDLINPGLTNNDLVVIGDEQSGLYFIIENDMINTIYISTGSASQEYFGDFYPDRG